MFNLRRTVHPIVKPQPRDVITLEKDNVTQYEKYCKGVGFKPRGLLDEKIALFFNERKMKIFDYNEVCEYMTNLVKPLKVSWAWRPLRKKDKVNYCWSWSKENSNKEYGYYIYYSGNCDPYTAFIPAHVLLSVSEVEKKFGNEVSFFVTDYADEYPDPFIMVTGKISEGKKFIFNVWDEPGFGCLDIPKTLS